MSQTKIQAEWDIFADFNIHFHENQLKLEAGPRLPDSAADYLRDYLKQASRYKNVSRNPELMRFSLYHPALNSQAGVRSLYLRLLRKFRRLRVPATATIGMTRLCQCSCNHCSADYHMSAPDPDLDTATMGRAFQETSDLGVSNIIMVGGEPLIRKDLEEIIPMVDPAQSTVTMFSNGELLTEHRARKLKAAGLSGIFFSLDSFDAEEHNQNRGRKNLFERLSQSVSFANDAGLDTALSSYLCSDNMALGQFDKMLELGRELNVGEVTFFDAIPTGRLQGDCHTFLTREDRQKINNLVRSYRKKSDFPAVSAQSSLTSELGASFCFAANTQFYLSNSGKFCPCDFTPLSAGVYPEDSIAVLWDKLIGTEPYKRRSRTCRMQDPEFREKYITSIPEGSTLPVQI